jgi:hypothetical protein
LSNDDVIRCISTHFVPVALNLYKIRAADDAGGEFFRSVQRQRPAQYQGLYLVTADGNVLDSHQNFESEQTWSQEVLATLNAGLKAFGQVMPRRVKPLEPFPFRGIGVQDDGSVSLAVYCRYMLLGLRPEGLGASRRDSLTLRADEWAMFMPANVVEGATWTVPDPVARKFGLVLNPGGDSIYVPRPEEVNPVQITGTVSQVTDGVAHLVFEGEIAAAHAGTRGSGQEGKVCRGEANCTGVGIYDANARQMLSLIWVWDGSWRSFGSSDDPPAKFGAVVEWQRTRSE